MQGGISGSAIIPGNSKDSLLVKRLLGLTDAPRMPLGAAPLPSSQIDMIRAWIDQGKFAEARREHEQDAHTAGAVSSNEDGNRMSAAPRGKVPPGTVVFANQIRPILAARCYQCHGPNIQQNGLRLDSLAAALKGSETGRVIVPGNSEKSPVIRRLLALDRPQMPYGGPPLGADEIKIFRDWIDSGAPGPDSNQALLSGYAAGNSAGKPPKHWSFIKPERPDPPPVKHAAWVRNPIDNFILARLEREGIEPSPEADKSTLIRRVFLDLIGIPPTPQEVDDFLADHGAERLRKTRGPIAGFTPLRREMGGAVARSWALRRLERL